MLKSVSACVTLCHLEVKSWPGLVAAGLSMLTGIFMLVTGPADTVVGSQASFNEGMSAPKSRTATPVSSQGQAKEQVSNMV